MRTDFPERTPRSPGTELERLDAEIRRLWAAEPNLTGSRRQAAHTRLGDVAVTVERLQLATYGRSDAALDEVALARCTQALERLRRYWPSAVTGRWSA